MPRLATPAVVGSGSSFGSESSGPTFALHVSSLHFSATKDELFEVMANFGPIIDVWIAPGNSKRAQDSRSRGFGYVTYANPCHARDVLELSMRDQARFTVRGRPFRIEVAKNKHSSPSLPSPSSTWSTSSAGSRRGGTNGGTGNDHSNRRHQAGRLNPRGNHMVSQNNRHRQQQAQPSGTTDPDSPASANQKAEFYMYEFCTSQCKKGTDHVEFRCKHFHSPYARRRDPRVFYYTARLCPHIGQAKQARNLWRHPDKCPKKDACDACHTGGEMVYHPLTFRTKLCQRNKSGERCKYTDTCRDAHSPAQLRSPPPSLEAYRAGILAFRSANPKLVAQIEAESAISPPQDTPQRVLGQLSNRGDASSLASLPPFFFMYQYCVEQCRIDHPHSITCTGYSAPSRIRRNPLRFQYSEQACRSANPTGKETFVAWDASKCPKGVNCEFAHTLLELQYHPFIYKTRQCRSHELQRCRLGPLCASVHHQGEQRERSATEEEHFRNVRAFQADQQRRKASSGRDREAQARFAVLHLPHDVRSGEGHAGRVSDDFDPSRRVEQFERQQRQQQLQQQQQQQQQQEQHAAALQRAQQQQHPLQQAFRRGAGGEQTPTAEQPPAFQPTLGPGPGLNHYYSPTPSRTQHHPLHDQRHAGGLVDSSYGFAGGHVRTAPGQQQHHFQQQSQQRDQGALPHWRCVSCAGYNWATETRCTHCDVDRERVRRHPFENHRMVPSEFSRFGPGNEGQQRHGFDAGALPYPESYGLGKESQHQHHNQYRRQYLRQQHQPGPVGAPVPPRSTELAGRCYTPGAHLDPSSSWQTPNYDQQAAYSTAQSMHFQQMSQHDPDQSFDPAMGAAHSGSAPLSQRQNVVSHNPAYPGESRYEAGSALTSPGLVPSAPFSHVPHEPRTLPYDDPHFYAQAHERREMLLRAEYDQQRLALPALHRLVGLQKQFSALGVDVSSQSAVRSLYASPSEPQYRHLHDLEHKEAQDLSLFTNQVEHASALLSGATQARQDRKLVELRLDTAHAQLANAETEHRFMCPVANCTNARSVALSPCGHFVCEGCFAKTEPSCPACSKPVDRATIPRLDTPPLGE